MMSAAIVAVVLPAPLASWVGEKRTCGGGVGFLLGLLLSWVGVFAVMCFPGKPRTRRCPECDERVRVAARVCKHCGVALPLTRVVARR